MKIYCVTWKDERWSADRETLKAINKMISKNIKTKSSFLSPETVLLYFMYCIGFIYHGSISFIKWIAKKIKR